MRKALTGLASYVALSLVLAPSSLLAQPELPPAPTNPDEVMGFLEALRAALVAFLEGLIGTSPI